MQTYTFIRFGRLKMNLAQRCIQQAKKRKDIPLLYSVSRKKTLGKNERKSTAEEVPARNIQKQGNMATPKQDSPNTRFKIPYRSIFLAITNIALNISITIFVSCATAYIALTYLSGGTSFANQRIESLLSATSPTTTQPSIAVEPPTDAAPPKEELVVKKDSEDHLASEKNNPREAPLISDGLPSGPIPKIAGKYTPPVESVMQQPVKSKRAQEGLSEDDQPVSKVKLLVVEKKAPAVTLSTPLAIEVNKFEVVALTSQSVVIKTDEANTAWAGAARRKSH